MLLLNVVFLQQPLTSLQRHLLHVLENRVSTNFPFVYLYIIYVSWILSEIFENNPLQFIPNNG